MFATDKKQNNCYFKSNFEVELCMFFELCFYQLLPFKRYFALQSEYGKSKTSNIFTLSIFSCNLRQ